VAHSAVKHGAPAATFDGRKVHMKKIVDLRFLFTAVAVLEVFYAIAGAMPPSLVEPATGWVLSPDGHWITKLLSVALAAQALVAWTLRATPHLGVAKALAFYQVASATVDWIVWLTVDGAFASLQAKVGVVLAIPTHYALGVLLLIGVRSARQRSV
jgi:hypothetical protein